jgi:hypothetical protein
LRSMVIAEVFVLFFLHMSYMLGGNNRYGFPF